MQRFSQSLRVLSVIAVVIVVWLFVRGMDSRRDPTATSPDDAFRALIADPIPSVVSDLQGGGTTWQGYSIALRFRAPSLEAAGFKQPPYKSKDCAEIHSSIAVSSFEPSPFDPAWEIPTSGTPVCLVWHELSNTWTTLGNHSVLFVDGWVFFVGRGS